ncbi:hypothetical protein [Parapedobacter sp. DT-150]
MKYGKSPISFHDQVERLEKRGLIIVDKEQAERLGFPANWQQEEFWK